MTLYLPSTLAAALSEALLDLAHVPGLRHAAETQAAFARCRDVHGDCWLKMDARFSIVVHLEAELERISELMQPWIDDGVLPAAALGDLLALLDARRGLRLGVHEALPAFLKNLARTHEEMTAAGLLAAAAAPGGGPEAETMVTLCLLAS